MQSLLQIGLSNAVCAAVLALLAAAVSWLVPGRPALSHAAWVLVLLKLLTPSVWTIHLPSLQPAVLSPVPAPAALETPLVQMPNVGGERILHVPAGTVPTRRELGISPGTVAAVAWLAGSLTCAALVANRLIRFGRILRYARPAPQETRRQAQDVALRIGLRSAPPIWLLPGRVSPMLWSAFGYARVLLPAELWGRLSPAQQSRLLAHELAHLRRGDQWVRLLEVAATVAYWWNPFLWWSRRELHVAEEACCDAWVAWAFAEDVHEYTSALVEAIDFVSRPSVPLIASGIGCYRTLQRRLVMIEQGKNVRGLGVLGIAVVVALMTVLPLSVKRAAAEPPPAPAKQPAAAAARSAPTTLPTADPDDLLFAAMQEGQAKAWDQLERNFPGLHVDKVAFSDVVDFLRDTSGIRVEVDWPGLGALGVKRDTPVTVDIHDVKFHKAFAIILETVGGGGGKVVYTIDKGNLLILPADAVPVVLQKYDVKDLIAGHPEFGPKLIAHLTETIDPSSWQEHNGKKGMTKLEGNTLYVAQTPENQRRVVNTLVLIRDQRQEPRPTGTRDN
jgi:beta-lactamase regulating signal transducer with metallopeptidase domain